MPAHSKGVDQLAWNPQNQRELASVSEDKTVCIYDAKTKKCIRRMNTPGSNMYVAWSPDGKTLVVSDKRDLVTVIDAKTGKKISSRQFSCPVDQFAFTPSGRHLACRLAALEGVVDIYDVKLV